MDDAADHPAIIDTRLATSIRRQMRLDPRKLRVSQPKSIPIHPRFLPEAVNHAEPAMPIILWVRTLASATLALSRAALFAPEPDEGVIGAAGLVLIKRALLDVGGSDRFPWGNEKGAFCSGLNREHVRRRWQFEFECPEHTPYRDAIWPESADLRQQAERHIALRRLADVDPDGEDVFASLN